MTNMKLNVKVQYRLSPAGQKAALVADRPASAEVTETMVLEDIAYVEEVELDSAGTPSLDTRKYDPTNSYYRSRKLELDAPPADIVALITMWREFRAKVDLDVKAEQAEQAAQNEVARVEAEEKAARDHETAEQVLTLLEAATDPAAVDLSSLGVTAVYDGMIWVKDHGCLDLTPALRQRVEAYDKRCAELRRQKAEAAAAEATAKLDAVLAEHGGLRWQAEGGMCAFRG